MGSLHGLGAGGEQKRAESIRLAVLELDAPLANIQRPHLRDSSTRSIRWSR